MAEKEDAEKFTDCITDQEREHAHNAALEFQKGNYSASLQNINKLESRASDFKVAHNKILLEYYKSDLKKTDNFQKNVNSLFAQFRIRVDKLDDVNHCVAHFNQAVIFFHQRQYNQAIRIMERVYKFIEPMDENLAKQVGVLLLELYIRTRQLDRATTLLNYLESQLFTGGSASGLKQGEKLYKLQKKDKDKEKKVTEVDSTVESFRKSLTKYKARCLLLSHDLTTAKVEIENFFIQDKDSTMALVLQANFQYLQGNYPEAIAILNNVQADKINYSETGESFTVILNNNLGVIHHAMGKPNMACHYYQTALKADIGVNQNSKKDNGDKSLHTLGSSRYHELVYNTGISLLHAKKPANAFECLIIAVRRFHRNSRLWLRLAECCIQVHKESNELDFDLQKKQKEMMTEIIGSKQHQKIILTSNLSKDKKYSTDAQSYAVPVPTLEFASLCLRNAYLLLPSDTISSPEPLVLIPGVTPQAPPPSPGPAPSALLSITSVANLKNAILAASAYVSLCLGDYILALEYAQTLLTQSRISGAHRLLAHLYAAEALVLLDKIPDALDHLNPENVKDIELELPVDENSSEDDSVKTNPPPQWFPSNLASAQAVMQYNIAVCKTLRGQLDQAAALLKQIWQGRGSECKVPALIIMLVLYIELQLGHADVARSLIKQYSLQYKISGKTLT